MEHWLKCNKCYKSLKSSPKEFYVTQCQHVFCSVCVIEARKQCSECKATGSQAISLKNTPPKILHYFSPLTELVDRALEAARFQKNQFMIFTRRSREVDEKYEKLKKTNSQVLEYKKQLQGTLNKLMEELEKLRVTDMRDAHHSVAENSNITHLSNNPMEEQRIIQRDSRKVPQLSMSYQSYAQRKIRVSNDQEHHIKGTLAHSQMSARSRSNARVVPQHQMITDAPRISMPSISADSRSLINHRDSQNFTQTHMMDIRPNLQFSDSRYQPRSILAGAHTHLERTPQEEIQRGAINRRIPQSVETIISPQSSTDCNTPNVAGHSSNYHWWNMPSR